MCRQTGEEGRGSAVHLAPNRCSGFQLRLHIPARGRGWLLSKELARPFQLRLYILGAGGGRLAGGDAQARCSIAEPSLPSGSSGTERC